MEGWELEPLKIKPKYAKLSFIHNASDSLLHRDYQTKPSQRTVGSTDQRRAGTGHDRDYKSHSGEGQRVCRMAALQTSRSVFLDIPLNRHGFAVPGNWHTRVFLDTRAMAGANRR